VVRSAANSDDDAQSIIFHIMKKLSKNDATMFACILWSIWKQCNNQIWNNVTDAQSFVFSRAATMFHNWRAVRTAATTSAETTSSTTTQAEAQRTWLKLMARRVKCNIDASFPVNSNRVRIGICIRDEHGVFILAKTEWLTPKSEVHVGEALGLLYALKWVHELNLGPVDFELDSKRVVDRFPLQVEILLNLVLSWIIVN
ncbi:cytochrome P450, partial [Trifolium medium]|nr:cytochrome P450 [Trifolium medium]